MHSVAGCRVNGSSLVASGFQVLGRSRRPWRAELPICGRLWKDVQLGAVRGCRSGHVHRRGANGCVRKQLRGRTPHRQHGMAQRIKRHGQHVGAGVRLRSLTQPLRNAIDRWIHMPHK
eukprot:363901-Chlamydomonas_euryale.AAC.15